MNFKLNACFTYGYWALASALVLGGAFLCWSYSRMSLLLLLNQYHHPLLDTLFPYISLLGSGKLYLMLLALSVFYLPQLQPLSAFAGLGVAYVINQACKYWLFPHVLRPMFLSDALYVVAGTTPKTNAAFPSGHAIVVFCIFASLTLALELRAWHKCLLLLVASLVAYSRVYLCQHCFHDVYGGAILGYSATWACFWLLKQHFFELIMTRVIKLLPASDYLQRMLDKFA